MLAGRRGVGGRYGGSGRVRTELNSQALDLHVLSVSPLAASTLRS